MKLSAILVALLSTLAYSERVDPHSITLNDVPSSYTTGDTAELLLVRKTPTGWEPAQKIFDEEIIHGGNGSATWKLRGVSHKKGPYALWLDGKFYPYDPKATSSTGYAALTPWFKIQDNTPYLPAGAIAGVVVGVLVGLALAAAGAWFYLRARRARKVQPAAIDERRSFDSIDAEKARVHAMVEETEA